MAELENNNKKYNFKLVDFLNEELRKKQKSNPRYSLRQFARKLGYESSFFSKILRGVSPVTDDQFLKITSQFEIDKEIKSLFYQDIVEEKQRFEYWHYKGKTLYPVPKEAFTLINHWSYFVILCMVELDDFFNNAQQIGVKLNLSEYEVSSAIANLISLNILVLSEDGELRPVSSQLLNEPPAKDDLDYKEKLKDYFFQVLKKQEEILKNEPVEDFSCGSTTIAIDSELKKEMISRSREFLKSLVVEMEERSVKKDCVMGVTLGVFPWVTSNK